MRSTLAIMVLFCAVSANAKVIEYCKPTQDSKADFNYVQISMDDRGDYSLAIEWNRPVGREDVEEATAEYYDDFTMYGYSAESLDATLAFYDKNDVGGRRTVLEITGQTIPVRCK